MPENSKVILAIADADVPFYADQHQDVDELSIEAGILFSLAVWPIFGDCQNASHSVIFAHQILDDQIQVHTQTYVV